MTVRKLLALLLLTAVTFPVELLSAPHEGGKATPVEKLATLTGFKIELLRSAQVGEGSWVSMAVDPKGRLFISPQDGVSNILRVTLSQEGEVEKVDTVVLPVGP